MFFILTLIASCKHEPVPVALEMMPLDECRKPREHRTPYTVLVIYEMSGREEANEIVDLFQKAGELATALTNISLDFLAGYDNNPRSDRIVCYCPEGGEGFFRVTNKMMPIQIATKIIHLSARVLKQTKRGIKEKKHPEIAHLKAEIRKANKEYKRQPTQELDDKRHKLAEELIQAVPENKRDLRRLKLQRKFTQDPKEKEKLGKLIKGKGSPLKFMLNNARAAWKVSRNEESEYDLKTELEKISMERQKAMMEMEEDEEEMETWIQMFKETNIAQEL